MTKQELNNIVKDVKRYLSLQRMRDAFRTLENAARALLLYDLTEKIRQAQQTYAFMLKYLTDGADDPQRDKVLNDLMANTYSLLDELCIAALSKETPTLYYNILRYAKSRGTDSSLGQAVYNWKNACAGSTSLSALFADASQRQSDARARLNSSETDVFNAIWTSFPLSTHERKEIVEVICDTDTPRVAALRFCSALGLASVEFFDPEVIMALCDIYAALADKDDETSRKVTAAALVWLLSALYKYSDRPMLNHVKARIEALGDSKTWNRDVRLAFMEMVRSHDTERINRTMRDEIIPGIMALRPEIEKKIRDIDEKIDSVESIGDNPEWEDILSNSELGDKLKELNDLHIEGSDIYMGTFSHLKNFSFFNEAVNWFTPLSKESYDIEKLLDARSDMEPVVTLVEKLPFICDSDKYSMLFSLDMIKNQQSDIMLSQLRMQSEQMDEMLPKQSSLTDADQRKLDIRNYIQNLYRFVNLFRRKSEFYNIFASEINLLRVDILKDALENAELLKLVGEFYFSHKYYRESLTAFNTLDAIGEFDSTLYQKMGFAYEKNGDYNEAKKYYEQSDLLDGSSRWLKLRLASVYRNLDDLDSAKAVMLQLSEKYPEDFQIAMATGYTFMQGENYREALKHFHKAEFLSPDVKEPLRPIAWSLFMIGDFNRSSSYYNRILMDSPIAEDYLNMGHVALAEAKFKEAINYYKTYIITNKINDIDDFFKTLASDRPLVQKAGVKPNLIWLIADAVLYEMNK